MQNVDGVFFDEALMMFVPRNTLAWGHAINLVL
jgi:hypothetical protein